MREQNVAAKQLQDTMHEEANALQAKLRKLSKELAIVSEGKRASRFPRSHHYPHPLQSTVHPSVHPLSNHASEAALSCNP